MNNEKSFSQLQHESLEKCATEALKEKPVRLIVNSKTAVEKFNQHITVYKLFSDGNESRVTSKNDLYDAIDLQIQLAI